MKFRVELYKEAMSEIGKLRKEFHDLVLKDYEIIESKGLEYVKVRHLKGKIFEIKTNEIRSLFCFRKEKIILVCVVFLKKTNKTPKEKIRLAKKRIHEVDL